MTRWFRFYDEALDDPKVQRLAPHLFKAWVNLLCLASKNEGRLPSDDDMAFRLRISVQDAAQQVEDLILAGLIDVTSRRERVPHNWQTRQYVSDSSAERTKKYRENKKKKTCDVTRDVTVTVQNRTDSDSDTDSPTVRHAPDIETAPPEPRSEPKAKAPPKTGDIDAGFEAWARVASDYGLPACKSVSEARRKRMAKRLKVAGGPEAFEAVLRKEIAGSGFLRGRKAPKLGHKPFKADVDFVLRDISWDRIVDGFYADAPGTPPAVPTGSSGADAARGALPKVYVDPQAEDAACAGMTLEEYRANIERLRALGKVAKRRVTHNAGQYRLDCSEQIGDASKSHGGQ